MMRWLGELPPWLLLLLCILYLLSPVDLFPDFLGLPGRIDDFLVALGTLYFLYTGSRKIRGTGRSGGARSRRSEEQGRSDRRESADGSSRQRSPGSEDPYDLLGVTRSDSLDEIRRRYRERLLQYHPDRVQHLGREFQEMAEAKTKEINEAFRKISRERGNRS